MNFQNDVLYNFMMLNRYTKAFSKNLSKNIKTKKYFILISCTKHLDKIIFYQDEIYGDLK